MDWQLLVIVAVLVTLNVVASVGVVRNPLLGGGQKLTQLLVVWLLPAVGSIICLVIPTVDRPEGGSALDRTAFVDSVGIGGGEWDAPPGSSLCGCDSSGGGADGGD